MAFDNKSALNHAIRYLTQVAERRAAGGWLPPKERERQQRDAMRQEQQQARQAEKQQKQQLAFDDQRRKENFNNWLKGSKFGKKEWYHHTNEPHENFQLNPNEPLFLTEDPDFTGHGSYGSEEKKLPLVVHTNVKNPFGPSHVDELKKRVHLSEKEEKLLKNPESDEEENNWNGTYPIIERPDVMKAIQEMGHDSAHIRENFTNNLIVFRPHGKVKAANYDNAWRSDLPKNLSNNGYFDPNDPDITKSEGGLILSKQFPTQYMPNVGRQVMNTGGVPDQPQRQLSPMGFYSAAAERAQTLQPSGDAVQMVNALKNTQGIKTEELQNAGLIDQSGNVHPDWAGRGKVTRDELMSHLQGQMPQVEETVLGGKQPFDAKRLEQLQNEYASLKQHPIDDPSFGEEKYNEMIRLMNIRDQSSTDSLYRAAEEAMKNGQMAQRRGDKAAAEKHFREHELLNIRAEKLDLQGQGLENPTKYSQYTLPGGENYREVLLRLKPEMRDLTMDEVNAARQKISPMLRPLTEEEYAKELSKGNIVKVKKNPNAPIFQSSHFPDPDILAHIRMADRTGPNGEKILHIEELQSDWGQKGKKEGFLTDEMKRQAEEASKNFSNYANDLRSRYEDSLIDQTAETPIEKQKQLVRKITSQMTTDEIARKMGEYEKFNNLESKSYELENSLKGLPLAPYVTSTEGWTDLALKRVLKEAAEGGYDKVVWTPGAEQAKRYDLSKQIDGLQYVPKTNTLYAYQNGRVVINKTAKPEELEDVVGKDVAKKLLSSKLDDYGVGNLSHYIEGQDLSVGGEGMKGYYDNIVPKRLQNLAKKHDKNAKLGYTETRHRGQVSNAPMSYTLPSLDITPAMRESILRGQPAYKRGGAVSKRHPALSIAGTHIREEEHGEPMFTGRL